MTNMATGTVSATTELTRTIKLLITTLRATDQDKIVRLYITMNVLTIGTIIAAEV